MTFPSKQKFCTIVTDASWCPQEKVGGWACWIVCENQRHKHFAGFRQIVLSPQEAEIQAIINGTYLAQKVFSPDYFHIVSDCVRALEILDQGLSVNIYRAQFLGIIGDKTSTFKHVKAHGKIIDARTYVNNWCDIRARMAMKKLRKNTGVIVPC